MNKKAQEFEAGPLAMGIIGGIIGVITADKMNAGVLTKIIAFCFSAVAGYLVSKFIADR